MNGAQALIRTLVNSGVDVCFSNPGTSEMHFVAALDSVPEMRAVLGLFEGVVTGAADGYGRMADRPAATLLHVGSGLGNGFANLHNARRAHTPVVNIVGDHATFHKKYDAPLDSDLESIARVVSGWVRTSSRSEDIAADSLDAIAASYGPPGQVATLALPANVSWSEPAVPLGPRPFPSRTPVSDNTIDTIAQVLRSGKPTALLLGGSATRERALMAAGRVASASGTKLLGETFPARLTRGSGIPAVERLAYLAEFTMAQLAGTQHLVLVDTRTPVTFFGYPGKTSDLIPDGCQVHVLADGGDDAELALEHLADALGSPRDSAIVATASRPDRPTGALTGETVAAALGALMPEGMIIADEANTSGLWAPMATAGAPPHDWLCLTGGAIGQGLPLATGAAVACPDRPVVCLEGDGSAMYTLQALWTQARESLNVTTVVFANHAYGILEFELRQVGAVTGGEQASALFDLTRPELDFVSLAKGMGVPASRSDTAEDFTLQLERALAEPGPHLIEAIVPRSI